MNAEHITNETLSALLDGEVIDAEQRAVTAHLSGCTVCTARLASLRSIKLGLNELRNVQTSRIFVLPKTSRVLSFSRYISAAMLFLGCMILTVGIYTAVFQTIAASTHSSISNSAAVTHRGTSVVNVAQPDKPTVTAIASPAPTITPSPDQSPAPLSYQPIWLIAIGLGSIAAGGIWLVRIRYNARATR